MKHNLFLSMLAAALLGSGVASAADYKVSDYSEYAGLFIWDSKATIFVDAQNMFSDIMAEVANPLTLDYQGEFYLESGGFFELPNEGDGVLNITTTVASVETKWEATFSDEGGGSITLCYAHAEMESSHCPVQFFGQDKDNTVKLGDSEVKYVGVVEDLAALEMNQVGIVWGDQDMLLVGKIGSSPTPEPTTGSLSLLALAGLAVRRRK